MARQSKSKKCVSLCAPPAPPDKCETKQKWAETVQEFLVRGNAFDLAVGLVIGVAFGKIVTSLIEDLIMPMLLCATGDFSIRDKFWVCRTRKYATIGELERAGIVTVGAFADLDAAVAAGVDISVRVSGLDEAKEIGLNSVNWGNFIQVLVTFLILVLVLASLVFAIQRLRCATERRLAKKSS